MAGHSKWSKVKRFKGAIDAKRGNMSAVLALMAMNRPGAQLAAASLVASVGRLRNWRMRGSDDRAEVKNLFTKPEAPLPQLEAFVDRQAYQNLRHGGSCGLRSGRASIHNSTSF
jgi:hypothetical protein